MGRERERERGEMGLGEGMEKGAGPTVSSYASGAALTGKCTLPPITINFIFPWTDRLTGLSGTRHVCRSHVEASLCLSLCVCSVHSLPPSLALLLLLLLLLPLPLRPFQLSFSGSPSIIIFQSLGEEKKRKYKQPTDKIRKSPRLQLATNQLGQSANFYP